MLYWLENTEATTISEKIWQNYQVVVTKDREFDGKSVCSREGEIVWDDEVVLRRSSITC